MRLILVLMLALVSCGGGDGGGDGDTAIELTRSGGCGEAYLWAATEDGTTVVAVSVEIPRWSTIDPVEIPVDLAAGEGEGTLLQGDTDLTRNLCVDVLDEEAEPDTTTDLVAGTGEVEIGPIPTDIGPCGHATGTLELADVVADDGTRIGSVEADTADVGCFAG